MAWGLVLLCGLFIGTVVFMGIRNHYDIKEAYAAGVTFGKQHGSKPVTLLMEPAPDPEQQAKEDLCKRSTNCRENMK